MLKELIEYTDFDVNKRSEYHYFNFTEAEIQEMNLRSPGGLEARLNRIMETQDQNELVDYFKSLILDSYGVKSEDGRRFVKSKELSEDFAQTGAYSALFMRLSTDTDYAVTFVNGIIPKVPEPKATSVVELPAPEQVASQVRDFKVPEMPRA